MSSKWLSASITLVLVALAGAVWLIIEQRQLMFPGPAVAIERGIGSVPRRVERVWLETTFGNVESWFLRSERPGDSPVLIFFHDRDQLIDDWDEAVERLRVVGVSVLLVEYPGYGHSAGRPSRLSLRQAATAAYDWVLGQPGVSEFRIVPTGVGLGGAVAAELSHERPASALIVHGAPPSTVEYVQARLPAPRFLVRDRFETRDAVTSFNGPVLLLTGVVGSRGAVGGAGEHQPRGFTLQRVGIDARRVDCRPDCVQGFGDLARGIRIFLESVDLLTQ